MYCQLDIDSNVKSEGIILKIIIPSTFKNSNSNNIVFPNMHIIPKEYLKILIIIFIIVKKKIVLIILIIYSLQRKKIKISYLLKF
jgi:hypothetical protein